MRRDRRLLIPLGLLLVSFVALTIQAVIVAHYIYSSVLDPNWESFVALYGVEPTSIAEFAIATVLLVTVTLVATLVPARRAARTHPAVVLRSE